MGNFSMSSYIDMSSHAFSTKIISQTLILIVFTCCGFGLRARCSAQDSPVISSTEATNRTEEFIDQLDSHLRKTITIVLQSGRKWEDVRLLRTNRDADGKVETLRILRNGTPRDVKIAIVREVKAEDLAVFRLAPGEIARTNSASESSGKASKESPDRSMRLGEKTESDSTSTEPKQKVKKKNTRNNRNLNRIPQQTPQEYQAWLARLRARGTRPWLPETAKEHQEALVKYRTQIADVMSHLPTVRLYETNRFLFCSNIPEEEVVVYVKALDDMYNWMCDNYGLSRDKQVWLGKCPVFAFQEESQFIEFEKYYFKKAPKSGTYGLCHSSSGGEVLIACYQGKNPDGFAHMLVHETSHGFVHRYKTKKRMPSWVNEGMAEYIAQKLVPSSKAVEYKEKRSLERLQTQRSFGGMFFTESGKIEFWQYGIASGMTRFLIETDGKRYVHFIEKLKEGMPLPEALYGSYGVTLAQLTAHYGKSIGIPDLTP